MSDGQHKNGNFTSTIGFVIACVGSAVGLGNIWMFPYRLGQYGGSRFSDTVSSLYFPVWLGGTVC